MLVKRYPTQKEMHRSLCVVKMLPTKVQVSWPFGSGEEAKNRFLRWQPSWISSRNDLSYF